MEVLQIVLARSADLDSLRRHPDEKRRTGDLSTAPAVSLVDAFNHE
jgi:hypothetical protein